MPNSFNFAQEEDPETYNKVQVQKQQAKQAQSNRLSELNQVYDAAQGEGASQSIRAGLDEVARNSITPTESTINSVKNMANRLQGTIPRLNIVAADTWENVLGKELTKKWYEFEGRDIDQVRNDAYAELAELQKEVLPTLSLTTAIQDGSLKNISAGMANAITSLGSSAIPAIATGGAGLFTEMTGDALVDFNEAKAKRLGISVDELYKQDKAEFGIPATIGALGGSLELIGLKGASNLISKKITGSAMKKAAIFFTEANKEGLTEFLQTGLEQANKSLGAGESLEDATKSAVNKMFSKEGLESYLQGIAGSAGAGGLAQVSRAITSPSAKTSFNDEVAKVNMLEMDLAKPEVSEQAKQVIANEINTSIGNMASIIEEDSEVDNKLSPEQREKVDVDNAKIDELQSVISDPNVSEETKKAIEPQVESLINDIDAIKPVEEPKEAVQKTKTPEPAETTTEVKETIVEPEIEPNEVKQPEITTEEVVEEDLPQKRTEEVLTKAETDLAALKQVNDKTKKYEASMKRLTEAKNNKEITTTEFNDLKKRFDDVIGESKPKVKEEAVVEVTPEQVEEAPVVKSVVEEAIPDKEVTVEDKVVAIQDRRQAIKDRISQKLKEQRGNLSSGFDPSLLSDFVDLGSTYIEEGIVKASDFVKRFREDYKDMGFDDSELSDEDIVNDVFTPNQPATETASKSSEDFKKITHKNIQSDEVSSTLNNVERETGRELTEEEKEYRVTKRNDALNHGAEVVEKAKEEFGKTYVSDLLNYLNENASTLSLENRALINISLELDLERQLQEDPDNITLNKQLKLVRDASTKFQRSAAIATGYGILRQIARVGYDINQVTDQFFSEQQLEDRKKLNKAIEATPADINKEAEAQENETDYKPSEDFTVKPKPPKKKFGLSEAQQKEKSELAKQFSGVFNDVTRIATLLADKKFMRYAKLVLLDTAGDFESFASNMITNVGEGIKEHLPKIYKKIGGKDDVRAISQDQKDKASLARETVKKALIDKGFGREITVTVNERDADNKFVKDENGKRKKVKEKRTVLDWKKLAGEEGSVDNIQNNVEESLAESGMSATEISNIQNELVAEYNRLHASIIEKSLNELQTRNQEREPIDIKTSAKKLAELYNYGLFDEQSDTYDNIVNRALGLSEVGQKAFQEAKVLAKALSDIYRTTDANGRKISEFGLKEAIRSINGEIEGLLTDVAWEQSNMIFKVATVAKEFMGLSQRAMLQTVKQILENPISGFIQRGFTKIGYSLDGTDTKALSAKRGEAAKIVYEDIVRNGGLNYGEIITPFVTRGAFEKKLDKLSDSKIYHTALSALLGRAYLDGADSMHKSALTERYFVHNLVRVLMKKGMPKEDAIEFVSNQLTGQKFTDALGSAKQIIDKANEDAGKKIINDNPNAIYRLAQNIVKDALVVGENITLREVESSYKAAYKAAGYDLGHEANNIVSETVSNATTKLENSIKEAVKEKKWNHAAALTFTSILTKNIINPFVSGGTNWIVLSLQKTGVDVISPIVDYARQKENQLDLTTKDGVKNMENALLSEMRFKNTMNRVVIGAMASMLVAAAAIASGEDEDLAAWLKKNDWAKKYFKVASPQALILLVARENKQVADYLIGLFGFTYDSFSDTKKLTQAFQGLSSDKKKQQEKGSRKLGEVFGGHTSFPGPWRVAKDVENIYRGTQGKKPIKPDYNKGDFWDGYLRNGVVEYFMLER